MVGDGGIQEDCQMYEWMALVRIVKCAVPMHVGQETLMMLFSLVAL